MANKYGNFSEPSYISINDPYVKKIEENTRNTGLNLKAAVQKSGKNNDALFTKFTPLYKDEKYEPTFAEKTAERRQGKEKMVADVPFKPPKPQQKTCGVGNYYGCIGNKLEHKAEFSAAPKKKGDFEPGPRNILVVPAKKGTYGFRGTTLGEKLGHGGAVGEYGYKESDYDAARKKEVADFKESIEKRVTDKAFRPTHPGKKGGAGIPGLTLGGKGPGIAGEYGYTLEGPAAKAPAEKVDVPFRPSHPPKQGHNSTLNRFPEYREDPLELKIKKEKEAFAKEQEIMAGKPNFMPPSVLKSGATVSVLRKNLNA